MGVEIERKYLVNKDIWSKSEQGEKHYYRQGYIQKDPTKTIRVRVTDTEGFLTIKGPTSGASRSEYEYKIPRTDAEELLNNFCSSVVSKFRHKVYFAGKLWEVDEFLEDNEGLIMAEIELSSEEETFDLPNWVDKEVTGDKEYYNSNLSVNPYKNWK